jgi:hypothetical protein
MNILSLFDDNTSMTGLTLVASMQVFGKSLTSEDRIEILNSYKAKLRSISLSKSVLQKSRTKTFKLAEKADRSFKRNEVILFFEELDTQVC